VCGACLADTVRPRVSGRLHHCPILCSALFKTVQEPQPARQPDTGLALRIVPLRLRIRITLVIWTRVTQTCEPHHTGAVCCKIDLMTS
jgi:hypothetical protein